MRQIGTLPSHEEANRFADYLLTQGLEATAEENSAGWAIWVRDENQLDRAREELEQFAENPSDQRYTKAQRQAAEIRRQERQHHEKVRKNTVEMRQRWNRPLMQRRPLTMVLIGLSVLVAVISGFGDNWSVIGTLTISEISTNQQGVLEFRRDFQDVASGQLWRLVTPIFIHFGILHLLFNSYMLFLLGGMIEDRRNTWRLGALVLVAALISNIAEFLYTENAAFGGMSGVVYACFGYVWMKSQFDPRSGFYLDSMTIVILVGWLFLCLAGAIGNVANTAHVAGILTGMAIGYFPTLFRRPSGGPPPGP